MNEQLCKRTAEIDRKVGASVRSARIGAGLSQSRLANALGITFQQLQKYEKGRNRIAVGTLLLIADALSVSVHSFLREIAPPASDGRDASDADVSEHDRLAAAFARIGDPEARRRILNLVLAVTEEADPSIAVTAAEPATAPA